MSPIVTVPTDPPTCPRTIPIAPPDDACPIAWATAVILETAAMLHTRRPATLPPCEETGRLQCSPDADAPLCLRCSVYIGLVYYGKLSGVTYKTGPVADAGRHAQESASFVLGFRPSSDDVSAHLLEQAYIWQARAYGIDTP